MDRSLKLKLPDPNPDIEPQEGYEVGGSGRKQWLKSMDGGCMAANGEECSMVRSLMQLNQIERTGQEP